MNPHCLIETESKPSSWEVVPGSTMSQDPHDPRTFLPGPATVLGQLLWDLCWS